jgi:hypothetical protein
MITFEDLKTAAEEENSIYESQKPPSGIFG